MDHLIQEFEALIAIARAHLDSQWLRAEVVVLKTTKGNIYVAEIPDHADHITREQLENERVRQMVQADDTEVSFCLATIDGKHPDILSWNFRKRLIEADQNNLETVCFLWGGDDKIHAKPFQSLLPPK